jgi:hypothetical protein
MRRRAVAAAAQQRRPQRRSSRARSWGLLEAHEKTAPPASRQLCRPVGNRGAAQRTRRRAPAAAHRAARGPDICWAWRVASRALLRSKGCGQKAVVAHLRMTCSSGGAPARTTPIAAAGAAAAPPRRRGRSVLAAASWGRHPLGGRRAQTARAVSACPGGWSDARQAAAPRPGRVLRRCCHSRAAAVQLSRRLDWSRADGLRWWCDLHCHRRANPSSRRDRGLSCDRLAREPASNLAARP